MENNYESMYVFTMILSHNVDYDGSKVPHGLA